MAIADDFAAIRLAMEKREDADSDLPVALWRTPGGPMTGYFTAQDWIEWQKLRPAKYIPCAAPACFDKEYFTAAVDPRFEFTEACRHYTYD